MSRNHANVPFLPGGYVGVDVFFVLSGYFTGMLFRESLGGEAPTGRISIPRSTPGGLPILASTPGQRDHEAPQALLERSVELTALLACASSVAEGDGGRLALVSGEAGIGKTALLRQFRRNLGRRFTVLWGACDPLFAPRPLGPLLVPADVLGGEVAALVAGEARPFDVAGALLAGLRAQAPSVLILEDLHWSDEATLDVVRLLARRVESVAGMIVLSFRDDEMGRTSPLSMVIGELPRERIGPRIELRGLSSEAVRQLAGESEVDLVSLHTRTSGNPFYVTEVLAAGGAEVPATVRDAVLARIARLSGPAQRLVDAVAVVPQRAEVWLLEQMAAAPLDALDECLNSGVLRTEADGVVFRHELARQAVVESLSPAVAVGLHRAALGALAGNPLGATDLARLAHHAEAAADADAVLRYAPAAGEQAAALGAPREAERQYQRALRFAAHLRPEQRAELLERYGVHAYVGTQRAEAADAMGEAITTWRQAGDQQRLGECLLQRCRLLECICRYPEARADAEEALRVLEAMPLSAALVEAKVGEAWERANTNLAESLELLQRALGLARELGDREQYAATLGTVGSVRMYLGDEEGVRDMAENLAISVDEGFTIDAGSTFISLGWRLAMYDRWRSVKSYVEAGLEYARDHGLDAWNRALSETLSRAELETGNWDGAADQATTLLAWSHDPLKEVRIGARVVLALVRARRGDPGVWPLLDRAYELAEENEEIEWRVRVAVARAEAAWLEGRRDAIVAATDAVCRPLLDAGHAALRAAHEQLRATPAAARAARRLRELGERDIPRGPRPGTRANPAGLTARELEVLPLLAEGLRNAEIAERLVVSAKTVDHHVSAILRKLDAGSRAQAVAAAAKLGAIER